MKSFLITFFTLFAIVSTQSCTRGGNEELGEDAATKYPNPNVCAPGDTDFDEWKPYCRRIDDPTADAEEAEWTCVECLTWCDCGVGEYCVGEGLIQEVGFRLSNYLTCQSYEEQIGQPCINPVDSGSLNIEDTYQTRCEISQTYSDRNEETQRQTLWTGPCVEGYCKACNSLLQYSCDDSCSDFGGSNAQALRCGSSGLQSSTEGIGSPRACYGNQYEVAPASFLQPALFLVGILAVVFF